MSIFQKKRKTAEADAVPTNVEQAIPICGVYEDGIFLVGRNLWAKTFRFTDINYAIASRDEKEGMFLAYSEIFNSLDAGPSMKDIVAVYAVKTNTSGDDFVTVDEKHQKEFRTVFYTMYSVRHYTTQREETVKKKYTDANGNPYYVDETVTRTVLHIERSTMSACEAADYFSFKKKQREYLDTLVSQDFDEMRAVLVD